MASETIEARTERRRRGARVSLIALAETILLFCLVCEVREVLLSKCGAARGSEVKEIKSSGARTGLISFGKTDELIVFNFFHT